jgi:amino acid transporter
MWWGGMYAFFFEHGEKRKLMILWGKRQSVIAWQAITASSSYLTATSLQGLIINSQPGYTPARWHGTLLIFALVFIAVLFATFFSRFFPLVETTVLVLHVTLFVVVIVVLTVMAPEKSSSENVWTLFLNEGGYESKGVTFMIGLITPIFAFSGADGAVHMSEEIRNSSRIVPWAMMCTFYPRFFLFGRSVDGGVWRKKDMYF